MPRGGGGIGLVGDSVGGIVLVGGPVGGIVLVGGPVGGRIIAFLRFDDRMLAGDVRQRVDDLVGELGPIDRTLGRRLNPDDDVVAVDLLEQDGRRGAHRRL